MSRIIITGSGSGLGAALVTCLESNEYGAHEIFGYDITSGNDVTNPNLRGIQEVAKDGLDILVNCAGVNTINWIDDVTEREWDHVMDTNVKGMFLMTQACLPTLRLSRGTVLNIVSNAATMPMRCSSAYNASKGAALILTKQMARELSPDVTVFSVSPNKLAGTGMSDSIDEQVCKTRGWSIEKAREYQLAGLLTGEETPVERCAEFIAFLLSTKERHKHLAGCDIPYGA